MPDTLAHGADLVAYTENLPPLNYLENGKPSGFTVELLQKMANEAGLSLDIQVMPWIRAYQTAQADHDSLLFTLVRTPERESLFYWIGPVARRQIYLFRLADRDDIRVNLLRDAMGYRVGVVREAASTRQLLANGFQLGVQLEAGNDDFMNIRKLLHGRIDLMLALDASAYLNLEKAGGQMSDIVPELLVDGRSDYYIGVNRGMDSRKLQALQQAFYRLQQRGELKTMQKRYFGR